VVAVTAPSATFPAIDETFIPLADHLLQFSARSSLDAKT
jgi:hypothetical protein